MSAIAICALVAGLAWGWVAYHRDGAQRTPEQRRRDFVRFAVGGAALLFAVADWLVTVAAR